MRVPLFSLGDLNLLDVYVHGGAIPVAAWQGMELIA